MIVFLDFDGVLHPYFPLAHLSDEENQHFSYLPNFEAVMRELPDVEVVISSSWRETRTLDELRALFSPDIAGRIIGKTPKLPRSSEPGGRQKECEAWLFEAGRSQEMWVGIDDVVELYLPGAVVVRAGDGFRHQEQLALKEAIENPARWAETNPVPNLAREAKTHLSLLGDGTGRKI